SLRSDTPGESEVEARAARAPTSETALLGAPKSPPPGTALRAPTLVVFLDEHLGASGKAGGGCAPAATYAAPSSAERMAARAQRALRALTRRGCLSVATAGSAASSATGHAIEQRSNRVRKSSTLRWLNVFDVVPHSAISEHRIEDGQQLAHACHHR